MPLDHLEDLLKGVDEKTRQSLQMLVTGPGATLPGLDELIRVEVDVAVERDTSYDRYAWDEPGSAASELMDALRVPRVITRMSLMPAAMATKNRRYLLANLRLVRLRSLMNALMPVLVERTVGRPNSRDRMRAISRC